MRVVGFVTLAFLGCGTVMHGQSPPVTPPKKGSAVNPRPVAVPALAGCQPSIAALKKVASDEWTASHDADRVLIALDHAIGPGAGTPWQFIDSSNNGLLFTVAFPQRQYRFSVSEALRKREPLSTASAPSVVTVDVQTTQIGAPNIEKVIVERDGTRMTPLSNSLAPHVVVTRLGAKEVLNSGRVTYTLLGLLSGCPSDSHWHSDGRLESGAGI
ncbi:MAG: hypothetical protein ACRD2I_26385 [Vicinamibacterales bacterium]